MTPHACTIRLANRIMSRKGTRGHARKSKADPASWAYAIAGNWPMCQNEADKIMFRLRSAYQRMREGNGDNGDFDIVGSALNIGHCRAELIDPYLVAAIQTAMDALTESDRGGRYAFTGPGILAMNYAVDLYEQILRNSTPRQMQSAHDLVHKRLLDLASKEKH